MRKIDSIILHCTATPEGKDYNVDTIKSWHLARGWSDIGYHFIIHLDGSISVGRPIIKAGAHAYGFNANSIGIAYVGGLDSKAKNSKDTRTPKQVESIKNLVAKLILEHDDIRLLIGHRDTSPDLNGNGTVERGEWIKTCPSFDVEKEYGEWFEKSLLAKQLSTMEDEIKQAKKELADKRKRNAGY